MDASALADWVARARKLCAAAGCAAAGDQYIGHALASSCEDADGTGPARAVREVIESAESNDLEQGLAMAAHNSRGVFTKAYGEGGGQEREIARKYRRYAEKTAAAWPRTSALLSALADSYEREASAEDVRVEQREARA